MFEFVNLPIGAIRADALAIEVNCLGVLDTIFSPQVRALFPEVVAAYKASFDAGEVMRELAGGYRRTTNNRMELLGAIVGLEALKEPCYVRLRSDSQYLVEYVNKGTLFRLHSAGWKGKQTKNIDLWKRFLEAYLRHEVELVWVKGHAGVDDNERCDQLATLAMRCGELPVDQGYVDEATARAKKSKSESQRQLPQFTLSTPDSSATSPLEAATSEAKRGPKPKKEGDPCRYCQIPLIRRTTKKSNPNSAYYYPWHLYCEKCKRLYHVPEAKVIRGKEMP